MRAERLSHRTAAWLLAAITLVGLGLRLHGAAWGLPNVYNPDELPILNRALALAKPDLNPHNFLYPTLYFYALVIWEGLWFVVGRLGGVYRSVAAFRQEFFTDPTHLIAAGRTLTALFGAATIPATYLMGRRLFDRTAGLAAAWFLAVAPFAVRDAHYIKHDVPVTFFVAATLCALARVAVDERAAARRTSWMAAGALAGLAMSTHYDAIVLVPAIIAVAAADIRRSGRWQASAMLLIWAGAASVVAFFAASPFILVEPHTFIRDLTAVREIDVDRAVVGSGAFGSLRDYLRMLAGQAVGWPVALLAGVGFVIAWLVDWRRGLLLAVFPAAFLAFLANTVPMSRYVNVMLPSIAVAAAVCVTRMASLGDRAVVPFSACVVCALPGLAGSVRSDRFFLTPDTRTLARTFIERTVPDGSSLLVQPYSVQLRPSHASLVEALRTNLGSETAASVKFQYELDAPVAPPAYRVVYLGDHTDRGNDPDKLFLSPHDAGGPTGLEPLRARHLAYVVLKRYNDPGSSFAPLLSALEREGHRIATFSPYRSDAGAERRAAAVPFEHNKAMPIDAALERPGPTIEIWVIP